MKKKNINDETIIQISDDINWDKLNSTSFLFSSYKSNSWTIEKDRNVVNFIKESKLKENGVLFSEVKQYYNISKDKIQELFESGLLSINSNYNIENFANRCNDKYSLLILHFSKWCNLACRYCFANADKVSKESMKSVLKFSDIKKIVSIIQNSLDIITEVFAIEFNSGEIFLHQDLLFRSIDYISSVFENTPYKVRFPLQTNGTIITSKIIKFLKSHNLGLSISLDGPKEIHDKNRPFSNNIGSFDVVFNNIKKAKKNDIVIGILSVLNFPENYRKLYEFILENKNIINGFKMNPVYIAGRQKKENLCLGDSSIEDFYGRLGKSFVEIIDDFLSNQMEKTSFYSPFDNFKFCLMNVLYPNKPYMCYTFPCGAGRNQLTFAFDNQIYPCQEFLEDKEMKLGDFREIDSLYEFGLNSVNQNLQNLNIPDDCKLCAYFPFCQNACSAHKYHFEGNLNSKIPDCKYYKEIYKYIFKELAENSSKLKTYISNFVLKDIQFKK